MKKTFRIFIGITLLASMLIIATDSCERPWATGTCYLHCSCNNCNDELSAEDNTKSDCESWWNTQKNNGNCGCPCTWEWVPY
jgi:hypothetical protein